MTTRRKVHPHADAIDELEVIIHRENHFMSMDTPRFLGDLLKKRKDRQRAHIASLRRSLRVLRKAK